VTAAGREPVALLDSTVSAYLGFRKDTGDRLKTVFAADPDFMMLFGRRAMVPRARRSQESAEAAARVEGVMDRESAHIAALREWVAGDLGVATEGWEAILARHP
jgi:hypothetical protein